MIFHPARAHRDRVDATARPVQQLGVGQFFEHDGFNWSHTPAVLQARSLRQAVCPGPAPELRGKGAPPATAAQHEQDAFQRGSIIDPRTPTWSSWSQPRREQRLKQLAEPVDSESPLPRCHGRKGSRADTPVLRPGLSRRQRRPPGGAHHVTSVALMDRPTGAARVERSDHRPWSIRCPDTAPGSGPLERVRCLPLARPALC